MLHGLWNLSRAGIDPISPALASGFLITAPQVKSESEVAQSCPTLSDPMDCSLPGSSVHGILQAGVLEWGAIAFSDLNLTATLFFSFTLETVDYILN